MKLRILLINPWIYDFAATNLWSSPLGILKVAECLSLYDVEFVFIDCTDSVRIKKYGKGKRVHPSQMTRIRRSWRRTKLSIKPVTMRKRQFRD